jgi:hypothetical protein
MMLIAMAPTSSASGVIGRGGQFVAANTAPGARDRQPGQWLQGELDVLQAVPGQHGDTSACE